MRIEVIQLTENLEVTLTAYIRETSESMPLNMIKPAILVLPGGGYSYCSDREAEVIALAYLNAGFNAFILRYSLGQNSLFPKPLDDAEKAIEYLRKNYKELHINPNWIAGIGFSAGGHLLAMLATSGKVRPDAVVLGYPCFMERNDHNLIYPIPVVDKATPEAFIFHTYMDKRAPLKDVLYLANEYEKNHIPFELHIYRDGFHGLSLANELVSSKDKSGVDEQYQTWFELSCKWLKRQFKYFEV